MRHDERGVTLIEMLVTMALMAGFLIILTTMFTTSVDVQAQSRAYAAVTIDGRFTLARLEYDIRRASAVTTPASPGSSGSSLVLTIGGASYTYDVSGGRLELTTAAGTDFLTSDQSTVSSLNFEVLGSGSATSVRYTYTVSSDAGHSTDSQAFTGATELRP